MLTLDDQAADLLFREAHTAQRFAAEAVSDARLQEIWELIRWAPTEGNGNQGRLLVVRSAPARERLVAHMTEGNKAKTLAAPLTVVTAADTCFHENLPRLAPQRPDDFERLEGDPAERERLAMLSATLLTAYFILGVRAAGLAAGPMGGFDRAGVNGEFFADGRWRSVLVINLGAGVPDGYRERRPRLEFSEVAREV